MPQMLVLLRDATGLNVIDMRDTKHFYRSSKGGIFSQYFCKHVCYEYGISIVNLRATVVLLYRPSRVGDMGSVPRPSTGLI